MDKSFLLEHYDEILQLLNCLKIGVYITDGDGNTLLVNDESCKTGGLSRSEVNGKNMRALVESGFVKESISLKTLASHKVEHMLQDLGDGGKVYATSHPVFHDGKIDLVINNRKRHHGDGNH
jgi:PAS domain S-box-containing protein